jgi:hypothetical protein
MQARATAASAGIVDAPPTLPPSAASAAGRADRPCPHHLYICHCSPSSLDPSPIHPPQPPPPAVAASSSSASTLSSAAPSTLRRVRPHGATSFSISSDGRLPPVYVTQTSVAVMTSPTLTSEEELQRREPISSASLSSLAAVTGEPGRRQITCNTIPRVLVSGGAGANGSYGGGRAAAAWRNADVADLGETVTMIARPSADGGHLHSAVMAHTDKYLECLWPSPPSAIASAAGTVSVAESSDPIVGRFGASSRRAAAAASSALTPPRSCLERAVLVLLVVALAGLLIVGALTAAYANGGGRNVRGGPGNSAAAAAATPGLETEDGIEIVRIRTTEEVVRQKGGRRGKIMALGKMGRREIASICARLSSSRVDWLIFRGDSPLFPPSGRLPLPSLSSLLPPGIPPRWSHCCASSFPAQLAAETRTDTRVVVQCGGRR